MESLGLNLIVKHLNSLKRWIELSLLIVLDQKRLSKKLFQRIPSFGFEGENEDEVSLKIATTSDIGISILIDQTTSKSSHFGVFANYRSTHFDRLEDKMTSLVTWMNFNCSFKSVIRF